MRINLTSKPQKKQSASIIVPINASNGISANLKKWLSNPLVEEFEIILVIDTTDDSKYAKLTHEITGLVENRIKILRSDHLSPGLTRNIGMRHASCNWIAFWDSDDSPNLEGFIKLIKLGTQNNLEYAVGRFQFRSELNPKFMRIPVNTKNWKKDVAFNPGLWRFVFKKESLKDVKFSERRLGEDQEFLMDYNFEEKNGELFDIVTYTYFSGNDGHITSEPVDIEKFESLILFTLSRFKTQRPSSPVVAVFFWRQFLTLAAAVVRQKQPLKLARLFATIIPEIFDSPPLLMRGFVDVLFRKILEPRLGGGSNHE